MIENIPPPDPQWGWIKLFLYAAFAALGGVLGHLFRTIDKGLKIKWGRAAIEGVASGFIGLLFYLSCQGLGLSEQWTGVIVGVAGWLGATASIKIIELVVYKKLGVSKDALTPTEGTQNETPVQ